MEDYNEDFATVLKVKGENFEEDTGGIWYDVHQTQAYNIDTVNAKACEGCILQKFPWQKETGKW